MSPEKRQSSRLIFNSPAKPTAEEERLRLEREKAAHYQHPEPDAAEEKDEVREMDEWADIVSKRIEEAIRRGDFDNLSGRGKPLSVTREPFVPEEQQMAFKLLKNNDMVPDWIAERAEVQRAIEHWRQEFQRLVSEAHAAWVAAQGEERRLQVEQRWERWIARWEAEIFELNRRINTLNLKQPITHLEVYKLQLNWELKRVGMGRMLAK